jgi:hypothetical protein
MADQDVAYSHLANGQRARAAIEQPSNGSGRNSRRSSMRRRRRLRSVRLAGAPWA